MSTSGAVEMDNPSDNPENMEIDDPALVEMDHTASVKVGNSEREEMDKDASAEMQKTAASNRDDNSEHLAMDNPASIENTDFSRVDNPECLEMNKTTPASIEVNNTASGSVDNPEFVEMDDNRGSVEINKTTVVKVDNPECVDMDDNPTSSGVDKTASMRVDNPEYVEMDGNPIGIEMDKTASANVDNPECEEMDKAASVEMQKSASDGDDNPERLTMDNPVSIENAESVENPECLEMNQSPASNEMHNTASVNVDNPEHVEMDNNPASIELDKTTVVRVDNPECVEIDDNPASAEVDEAAFASAEVDKAAFASAEVDKAAFARVDNSECLDMDENPASIEMDKTDSARVDNPECEVMDNNPANVDMDETGYARVENLEYVKVESNPASIEMDKTASARVDNPVCMKIENNPASVEMGNTVSARVDNLGHVEINNHASLGIDNRASMGFDNHAHIGMDGHASLEVNNPLSMEVHNPLAMEVHNPLSMEVHNPLSMEVHNPLAMEIDNPATALIPFTPTTPTVPLDNNEQSNTDMQPNKRRRKKSIVWEHFTIETVGAGCTRACCKQCKKSFAYITGSKLAGTSHLKRHIALGICPVSRQRNQQTPGSKTGNTPDPPKRRYRASPGYASIPLDQDRCYHEIAKMIILHDYPLHIVEHPGFIDFVRTLQPQFNMVSFNTIQGDCVAMYLKEKQNLMEFISRIPGRVSFTLDMWTSNQSVGYVFLTGHFIDNEWNLHRRILNVVMVASPDSASSFIQAVAACLTDWHLECKLFSLTIDESISNETATANLRGFLSVRNQLLFNGQLVIGNCYARVISRLAQDALGPMAETIKKIRDNVKFVKTSDFHEEKFFELKQQLQVPSTKDLFIDDQTKWNTTYHMLVAACELKEVFSCLETYDPDYKIAPSMDEWRQAEILCMYLKFFFDAANILTSPAYPTANAFYHEVSKVQLELTHASFSQDPFVSNLTKPLKEQFDKYWNDCFLVLAVAVVMDPRFKMKLIEFSFSKIYGEDAGMWIKIIDDNVHELFYEYNTPALPPPETFVGGGNEIIPKPERLEGASQEENHNLDMSSQEVTLISVGDGLSDFEVYISEITSSQQLKSELDQYLEESLLPRAQEFDILCWWKLNRIKYPTLSRMASDILSMPFSTLAPDSVFDTKNKMMDSYRGSLRPVTLEALICAKDWFQYASSISHVQGEMARPEFKV